MKLQNTLRVDYKFRREHFESERSLICATVNVLCCLSVTYTSSKY